jgi:maleylacetate reductase
VSAIRPRRSTGVTEFVHQTLPQRVVFGAGAARTRLADEVAALGATRVLLITTGSAARTADRLADGLPVADRFHDVRPHVPVEVAEAVRSAAARTEADLLLSVGGGSATGTAKAAALTTGLPIVAVPTTYAGSEATPVWGMTEDRRKITGTDARVLPTTVVYDPELTLSLPAHLSVTSGLNALAHCVDSLWAPRANPILSAMATEGIRALSGSLRAVHADGQDIDARGGCLYGAYLSAVTFAGAGSGLHHKICHVLGGTFDLPHADTHAVVLPHVLAFNAPAAPDAAGRVADAMEADGAVAGLLALSGDLDAPRSLRDLGMPEDGIATATEQIVAAAPADNPRPVTSEAITALLHRAWAGEPPEGSAR